MLNVFGLDAARLSQIVPNDTSMIGFFKLSSVPLKELSQVSILVMECVIRIAIQSVSDHVPPLKHANVTAKSLLQLQLLSPSSSTVPR